MKMKQWIALALSLVMLMTVLPVVAIEEQPEIEVPEQPEELPVTFSDLNGLKELCGGEYSGHPTILYEGEEDLLLEGEIRLPVDVRLEFGSIAVTVADGAEITVPENTDIVMGSLTVAEGGKVVNAGNINVEYQLTVAADGVLECFGQIEVPGNESLSGAINFRNDGRLMQHYRVETLVEMKEILAIAAERVGDRTICHVITVAEESEICIDEDITIYENCDVFCHDGSEVTVAEDVTVVLNGMLSVMGSWTVNGILQNENCIHVWNNQGGVINFVNGGESCVNRGILTVYCALSQEEEAVDFAKAIPNFNFDGCVTREDFRDGWAVLEIFGEGFHTEGGNDVHFSDFAELKQLLEKYDAEEEVAFRFAEEGLLTVTEDITVSDYVELYVDELKIPKGITMVMGERSLTCQELTVEGTLVTGGSLHAEKGITVSGCLSVGEYLFAGTTLSVTGELELSESGAGMRYPARIDGIDRIRFYDEGRYDGGQKIRVEGYYSNAAELEQICKEVTQPGGYIDHPRVEYFLDMRGEEQEQPLTIDTDLVIPEYLILCMSHPAEFVIAAGNTVTVNGELQVYADVTFNGTLVNNNWIHVGPYLSGDPEVIKNGCLIIADGEKYSGRGIIRLHVAVQDAPFDGALVCPDEVFEGQYGFDPEGFREWEVRYVAGLIQLATPLNPVWGIDYITHWEHNEETGEDYVARYETVEKAGTISWETDRPDQAEAEIIIYKVGENGAEDEEVARCHYGFGIREVPEYRSVHIFLESDLESGTYYFTVRSKGDYVEYRDSEIAVSGTYTYVKPDAQIAECTDLYWDGLNAVWTAPQDDFSRKYMEGYEVEFFFSPDDSIDSYKLIGGTGGRGGGADDIPTQEMLPDWIIQEGGIGFYKFRVRSWSANIEKACNGNRSALSPALDLAKISDKVNDDLDTLIGSNTAATPDEVRAEVQQQINTEELRLSLLSDQDNSGTTEKLAQLEDLAGGPAAIDVKPDASPFNASEVSVVGANLNTKSEESEGDITLVIDRPEEDHVIPERYNSSVAVSFSMDLANVEDTENLIVPVKITLPIPESINPHFLVVLHYHQDGSHEEIWPYVYEKNGSYYADFVLTSFSDFVMTQEENGEYNITLDANGGSGVPMSQATQEGRLPELPTPEYDGYRFDGWYTQRVGGVEVTLETVFEEDTTIYAHWTAIQDEEPEVLPEVPPVILPVVSAPDVPVMPAAPVFSDVAASDYYYDAVQWAVAQGITQGVGTDTFAPNAACTRAQMMTFLWRAAGCPEPASANSMFADVDAGQYYAKAVQWAVEQGITNGAAADRFAPDAQCTRAQMAAFLYRLAGSPAVTGEKAFGDVAQDAYYNAAVAWAAENGITVGSGNGNFGPDADCTRAQIVTFLYRYFVK